MATAKELAKALSKQRLAEILADAAATDDALNERIKLELLGDQTTAIATEIKTRIRHATRPRKNYVRYGESFAYGARCHELVEAIEERLLPLDPDQALAVAYYLLQRDEVVFEQVDDSGGDVGEAFMAGARVFVKAAANARDRDRLFHATLDCIRRNGYGVRDPIHKACGRFLRPEEFAALLEALREDWLNDDLEASKQSRAFNYTYAASSSGDPDLYREVLLRVQSGNLHDHDHLKLAQLHAAREEWETALQLLDEVTECPAWKYEMDALRVEAWSQTGREAEVTALHRHNFSVLPSRSTYEQWLAALPPTARSSARLEAIDLAAHAHRYAESSLTFLLEVGETERAAQDVEAHVEHLSGGRWDVLPGLARRLEKAGHATAASLLYRLLLEDILDEARSSAYRHAALDGKALDRLAPRAEFGPPHESATGFRARLTERHRRKSSFWRELGEDPGKGSASAQ